MNRLVCWLFGHDWHAFPDRPEVTFQVARCRRCKEVSVDFDELVKGIREG